MVKFRWIFLASYGESSGGQGLVPRSRMGVDGPSSATEKHLSGSHNVDVTVAPERVRFNIFLKIRYSLCDKTDEYFVC